MLPSVQLTTMQTEAPAHEQVHARRCAASVACQAGSRLLLLLHWQRQWALTCDSLQSGASATQRAESSPRMRSSTRRTSQLNMNLSRQLHLGTQARTPAQGPILARRALSDRRGLTSAQASGT